MIPLPPLSFTGGSATGGTAGGAGMWSQGDWAVNLGGSGIAMQAAAGGGGGMGTPGGSLGLGLPPIALAFLAVGAAWLLLRRK